MSTETSRHEIVANFQEFYWLRDGMKAKPMRVTLEASESAQQLAIDLSFGHVIPKSPVPLMVARGHEDASFLWSTLPPLLLAADVVVRVLLQHNITGWQTYPVDLSSMSGKRIGGYHGFVVTGRLGKMMPLYAIPELMPSLTEGGKPYLAHKGICFDLSEWDHSDIGIFTGASYRIIHRNALQVLKKMGTTNVRYQPISEIVTDAFLRE